MVIDVETLVLSDLDNFCCEYFCTYDAYDEHNTMIIIIIIYFKHALAMRTADVVAQLRLRVK